MPHVLLAAALPCQALAFVPRHETLYTLRATGVPQLVAAWPQTALGRLFEDEDARHAGELATRHTANRIARQLANLRAVQQLDHYDGVRPYMLTSVFEMQELDLWRLLEMPAVEVTSAELVVLGETNRDARSMPRFVRTMSCRPRFAGRWTQRFEAEARARAGSKLFQVVPDARIDSYPAHAFAVPQDVFDAGGGRFASQQWMLQLPGRLVYGAGDPAALGEVAPALPSGASDPELRFTFEFGNFRELLGDLGQAAELTMLGADKVERFSWHARFVDALVYDVMTLEMDGAPGGLLATLLGGRAALPAQALPEGGLAQVRWAIDLQAAFALLAELDDDLAAPPAIVDAAVAALNGGFALSCCAPADAGLIPRLYLTATVADEEALDALLSGLLLTFAAPGQQPRTKSRDIAGVTVTSLQLPGGPQGLQPAWCVTDGKLHVAESARSLRALLRAQAGDAVAMDVDGMAPPDGPGDVLPGLDLRFDLAAIYRSYYERWLPACELLQVNSVPPPLTRDDLPDPDVVAEHLQKGRGVLRQVGDRYSLVQASGAGGLEAAALLFTWSTLLETELRDYTDDQRSRLIASRKLPVVYEALTRFERQHGRRPRDLSELVRTTALPLDALLMPGDDLAEPHTLADGRAFSSSFRYFPAGADVGSDRSALLVEVRQHRSGRAALMADGTTPELFGDASTRPIDQLRASGSSSGAHKHR